MEKYRMDCINQVGEIEDTTEKLDYIIDSLAEVKLEGSGAEAELVLESARKEVIMLEGFFIDYIEKLKNQISELHSTLEKLK